jgi:uncharacterized repeat protein (TIGR03837 family)
MNNPSPIHCDIFCRVVDNYGDAGVCWRLARQLASEHGWRVRLWIDDPAPLDRLAPDRAARPVEVAPWPAAGAAFGDMLTTTAPAAAIPDIVIEAFACEPPESYLAAMARRAPPPVWLNLEYLTAETWIGELHGLPSPHPRLPLVKHFFFPGFDECSGGLLRETDYATRRRAFDAAAFRAEFGLPMPTAETLTISLFSYPHAPLAALRTALARSKRPIQLLLPGSDAPPFTDGALQVLPLPFLPQPRYDELLWLSDLNFVRGEDSFVRAQLAGKPFVWQIYPQADQAHRAKLDAFLARYAKVGNGGTATERFTEAFADATADSAMTAALAAMADFWHAWNGDDSAMLDWPRFAAALPTLASAAQRWAAMLARQPDLAANLVRFCHDRLK